MTVTLHGRTNPLNGQRFWTLRRVADGRTEASGFTTTDEAREYAEAFGLTITEERAR